MGTHGDPQFLDTGQEGHRFKPREDYKRTAGVVGLHNEDDAAEDMVERDDGLNDISSVYMPRPYARPLY